MLPYLLLVNGLPCSGKTTISRRLANSLRLPFLEKDQVKELLFDALGWSDVAWSHRLSRASKDLLFYLIREEMKAGRSLGVECNFFADLDTPHFLEIAQMAPFHPIQVLCWADGEELVQRFKARSGGRHPGHLDATLGEEIFASLRTGTAIPLAIGGDLIEFETTHFAEMDYEGLVRTLRKIMQPTTQAGMNS